MADWDITVSAGSTVGSGTDVLLTDITGVVPGDFDGATINSVTTLSSPTVTSDGTTDDTIGIRLFITTAVPADTFGSDASDAASMCYAVLGDSVASATITDGSSRSPNPTTAVAADWDEVRYSINYTANMKADGETISWSSFTVRVNYTPAGTQTPKSLSYTGTGTSSTVVKDVSAAKTYSGVGTASLVKQVNVGRAYTGTGSSSFASAATHLLALAYTGTGTSNLVAGLLYTVSKAYTGAGTLATTLTKTFVRAFTYSGTGTVSASQSESGGGFMDGKFTEGEWFNRRRRQLRRLAIFRYLKRKREKE